MHNNVFDLPALSGGRHLNSVVGTSMQRLEQMNSMINSNSLETMLCGIQANFELLHIKAKNYHWNVSGAGFQGVHEMFDALEDFARDSGDRIAERMRYHGIKVNATATAYLSHSWFLEGNADLDMDGMLLDMCMTLCCFIDKLAEFDEPLAEHPVDQNMIQEMSEGLGKYCYFVKSNMSDVSKDIEY